jgi:hypothetical protein
MQRRPQSGDQRLWRVFAVLLHIQGPREDTGFSSSVDTGVRLASQLFTYCKKYHPKTQVMASGLRTKKGEQADGSCLPSPKLGLPLYVTCILALVRLVLAN